MKRIALQLLLSIALIFQGAYAFGMVPMQSACCCHDGHAAPAHCQTGHDDGTPCKQNCAQHCVGCATAAFVAMPAFAVIAPAVSAGLPSRARAAAHTRDDLPPTRPPIV